MPAASTGARPAAICAAVRSALPGVTSRSPPSTTESAAKTSMASSGCQGRSSWLCSRIAAGPKRAPARKLVAVSNGTPSTATSAPAQSVTFGQRAKVRTPVYRGAREASGGP